MGTASIYIYCLSIQACANPRDMAKPPGSRVLELGGPRGSAEVNIDPPPCLQLHTEACYQY